MAGEIQLAHSVSALTLYAHLWNNVGQIYNTVAAAFETYLTANVADYDVAMTEQGTASRFYRGNFPAVAAGYYHVTIQQRVGASPAEADPYVGDGEHFWNGTALFAFPDRADYTASRASNLDNLNATVSSRAAPGDAMDLVVDAVDAAAVAASAVTEIQSGLATSAALAAVQADTDDIQSRLPTTLSSGRMRSQIEGMDAGTITAATVATDAIDGDAIAPSAVTEIQAGLATSAALTTAQADLDDIQTRLPAALISGRMDVSVGAMVAAVQDAIVNAFWDELISEVRATGSFGQLFKDRIDVAISSRAATGAAMTLTAGERDSVASALLDLASGVETSFTVRQTLRLMAAMLCGKSSGGPGASVFRNMGDSADRVTTVADVNGNRTTMTLTP